MPSLQPWKSRKGGSAELALIVVSQPSLGPRQASAPESDTAARTAELKPGEPLSPSLGSADMKMVVMALRQHTHRTHTHTQ